MVKKGEKAEIYSGTNIVTEWVIKHKFTLQIACLKDASNKVVTSILQFVDDTKR